MHKSEATADEVLFDILVKLIVHSDDAWSKLGYSWHVARHHTKVTSHSRHQNKVHLQETDKVVPKQ